MSGTSTTAFASELKRSRGAGLQAAPETVTAALVLMGITPFFRAFGPRPTMEEVLPGHDEALIGLSRVMQRAERASRYALAFAAHPADPNAAVIHSAAPLHDFAASTPMCSKSLNSAAKRFWSARLPTPP